MKQSFHLHFDRDLSKAGSAILREAVRRGLLSQHEAMIHDQQWAQFSMNRPGFPRHLFALN